MVHPYLTLMAKMEPVLQLRDSVHARSVVVSVSLRSSTLRVLDLMFSFLITIWVTRPMFSTT